MAQNRKSLREALARTAQRPEKEVSRPDDKAAREAIARESSVRYRDFVSVLNRTRDREIEKALKGV